MSERLRAVDCRVCGSPVVSPVNRCKAPSTHPECVRALKAMNAFRLALERSEPPAREALVRFAMSVVEES